MDHRHDFEKGLAMILYRSALSASKENTDTPRDRLIMKFSNRQ